ncbi:MAG: hypothetical protein ACI84R_002752 [Candidatus Azotimanducaceae bacterium]|jgi:hypothetical protein
MAASTGRTQHPEVEVNGSNGPSVTLKSALAPAMLRSG